MRSSGKALCRKMLGSLTSRELQRGDNHGSLVLEGSGLLLPHSGKLHAILYGHYMTTSTLRSSPPICNLARLLGPNWLCTASRP